MKTDYLGPFIGHVTETTAKIWFQHRVLEKLFLKIYDNNSELHEVYPLNFTSSYCFTDIAQVSNLNADTKYKYKLFKDENCTEIIPLDGLDEEDLFFRTMPTAEADAENDRLDFLLMSCHNPDLFAESKKKKYKTDGYEVWRTIPNILLENNNNVRFAILGGDQIYADDWRIRLEKAKTQEEKREIYLEIYDNYWSNLAYRKVLCSLPAYLMWDDHDIMDGWGSSEEFFNTDKSGFKPSYEEMFLAAKDSFKHMQSSRNPEGILPEKSFDSCFKVGRNGFILADLRSNRNAFASKEHGQIWLPEQFESIKNWVNSNKENLDTLFFVTPVVMAHGAPEIEEGLVKHWDIMLSLMKRASSISNFLRYPLYALVAVSFYFAMKFSLVVLVIIVSLFFAFQLTPKKMAKKFLERFEESTYLNRPFRFLRYILATLIPKKIAHTFMKNAGDLRDDINDSWGASINAKSTHELLDFLFESQNENNINVVVLSGDIHAGGYANIYSSDEKHLKHAVIPHIVSSPVGYTPFPWFGEAVFRAFSKTISLGLGKKFTAQISHHFTDRNVVVCSIRKREHGKRHFLKVKYYVEGFNEPQIMIFDLIDSSHKEEIKWD